MNKKINKQTLIALFITVSILFISCSGDDKFKIEKGKVGLINTKTTVKELDAIFKNDSIVKNYSEGVMGEDYFQDDDEFLVYDKEGNLLLTIMPKEQLDSVSTIKSIEIHDPRFKTESGVNLNSSFSEINANNTINRVETTLSSATLFIDELNATVVIDKQELGLKEFSTQKISKEQIPDLAKMKSFVIWFN